jgi:FMN reductase
MVENAEQQPLRVVAVSGSLHTPSKTSALVHEILARISEQYRIESHVIELSHIGPEFAGALTRDQVAPSVETELRRIENADLLIVASPVYRGSFTGLFKHLFDFVGQYSLVDKPVLVAATGGGERHALILEHQFRPLFGFFQALTLSGSTPPIRTSPNTPSPVTRFTSGSIWPCFAGCRSSETVCVTSIRCPTTSGHGSRAKRHLG